MSEPPISAEGPVLDLFPSLAPTFSDATEPRPFWYGCWKLDNSMSWRTPKGSGFERIPLGRSEPGSNCQVRHTATLLERKVAGPSMLGSGCPDHHARPFKPSPMPPRTRRPPSSPTPAQAGSFPGYRPPSRPRCTARPLSGGVRPLEPRTSAFPRFRRLHCQQRPWRPGGLEGST